MTDLVARLNAVLADCYKILSELGRGGMATVYLAHDLKHNRNVALKVLRPEVGSALGADRFLHEIELSARLNHPHILTLIDSGEADGLLYYVMPFVEGESLRERLHREGQLPLDDALRITREVADALGYAHSLGIVHRDIKPENIMFEAGHAVVTDFGIARAVTEAGTERLTETGLAVGTPAYMSPEQASGEHEIDSRADIYALGCVMYEMLGGEPPFTGPSVQAVLARKSVDTVPSLRALRETVSDSLEGAVYKALARTPADRFRTAQQLVDALEAPGEPPSPRPIAGRLAVAAATVMVIAAFGYFGIAWLQRGSACDPESGAPRVVVLPFEILGPVEDAYLAAGITDEITSKLAKLSGLRVIARTSAVQYEGTGKTVAQIGDELDAAYALEGTVRWDKSGSADGRVRVLPQLIRTCDETHVWAEPYEAVMADIFGLQAAIAEHVATALSVTLLEPERAAVAARPTENIEAYDAYLRGNQVPTGVGVVPTDRRRAIAMYERAVDLDPEFAEAHARLSMHYSDLARSEPHEVERALPLAERHAELAVLLDSSMAWGHLAFASYERARSGDWERVLPHLIRAEQADPNSDDVLEALAFAYYRRADWESLYSYGMRALELNPLNGRVVMWVAGAHSALSTRTEQTPGIDLEQFERDAERYFARAIELSPEDPAIYSFQIYFYLYTYGDMDRARAVLQEGIRRMGRERMLTGFLSSIWWGSRVLAQDEWYRDQLEAIALGPPDLDSSDYYLHKMGLYQGVGDDDRARAYADSATWVLEGSLALEPPGKVSSSRALLAAAYAGTGRNEDALREIRLGAAESVLGGVHLALVLAEVGEHEEAIDAFELIARGGGFATPTFIALDPTLAPLREYPRFRALLGGN